MLHSPKQPSAGNNSLVLLPPSGLALAYLGLKNVEFYMKQDPDISGYGCFPCTDFYTDSV